MVDSYRGPFSTHTAVQAIAGALKTELKANIQSTATLIGVTIVSATSWTYVDTGAHPDFTHIPPSVRAAIAQELASLWGAVGAAP